MLNLLLRVLRILLLAYLMVLFVMVMFENSLIFFPSKYPEGIWSPAGLNFEDAYFEAPDGMKLHGWYVPHEHPRAVVLIAHGNGGNLSHRFDYLKKFHDRLGASVM